MPFMAQKLKDAMGSMGGMSGGGGFIPPAISGMGGAVSGAMNLGEAGIPTNLSGILSSLGGNNSNSLPSPIPTPMGGLPPNVPPIQGPGSLMGVPPVSAPAPSPMGGLPGGNGGIMGGQDIKRNRPRPPMNSTVTPPMRNGGVGGVAPRPAQSPGMRSIRGRGGMSMF